MFEPSEIRARLELLRGADLSNKIFGAERHRYQLTPPWSAERMRTFEARHGVQLPEDYWYFATKIGAAGAGPGYGLYEPGTWDDDPRSWERSRRVGPLARPFPHQAAWNLPRERLANLSASSDDDVTAAEYWAPAIACGAMPIASLGGGKQVLLVVTGAERGRIWIDDRAHDEGLAPEGGLDFEGWYRAWLDGSEALLLAPPRPRPTRRRMDRPPRTVHLDGIALEAAERLRDRVHAALAAGESVDLGPIGRFVAGAHPRFEQGALLRDAVLIRAPAPGTGDANRVFTTVLALAASGGAVEVPGLFAAWRAEAVSWEHHDYLGRRRVTDEPAMLVVALDPALPRSRR
jgi:hypothetical protein